MRDKTSSRTTSPSWSLSSSFVLGGLPSRFTQNILAFEMILQKKWMKPLLFFDLVLFQFGGSQRQTETSSPDMMHWWLKAGLVCSRRSLTLDKVSRGLGGDKARSHLLMHFLHICCTDKHVISNKTNPAVTAHYQTVSRREIPVVTLNIFPRLNGVKEGPQIMLRTCCHFIQCSLKVHVKVLQNDAKHAPQPLHNKTFQHRWRDLLYCTGAYCCSTRENRATLSRYSVKTLLNERDKFHGITSGAEEVISPPPSGGPVISHWSAGGTADTSNPAQLLKRSAFLRYKSASFNVKQIEFVQ